MGTQSREPWMPSLLSDCTRKPEGDTRSRVMAEKTELMMPPPAPPHTNEPPMPAHLFIIKPQHKSNSSWKSSTTSLVPVSLTGSPIAQFILIIIWLFIVGKLK